MTTTRTTMAAEMLASLNSYTGDNLWQDVIDSDDLNEAATDQHAADGLTIVFADNSVAFYRQDRKQWIENGHAIEIRDGVTTWYWIQNSSYPGVYSLRNIAAEYAAGYDFSDSEAETVCQIVDHNDGQTLNFLIAANGDCGLVEYPTSREYIAH